MFNCKEKAIHFIDMLNNWIKKEKLKYYKWIHRIKKKLCKHVKGTLVRIHTYTKKEERKKIMKWIKTKYFEKKKIIDL